MKATDFDAVIFDLDDTLYEERTYVAEAMKHTAEYVADKYGIDAGEAFAFFMDTIKKQGRGKVFDEFVRVYKADASVKELVDVYRSTRPFLRLCEDSERILDHLEKNQIKTGVITDGNKGVQRNKVTALGVKERVDAVILTDELENSLSKPDLRVYRACLEKLGADPTKSVYIGDNPAKDFIGARKLGMKTIRIIREHGLHERDTADAEHEADLIIRSLDELI